MGTPPHPRRAHKARRDNRTVHRVGDPPCRGHRAGTATLGSELAAVPARPGRRDRRSRFLHVDTVLLKRIYVLVFIEHGIRRMHLGGVTAHPTGDWTVQQARNLALTLGERFEDIRFLIHDRGLRAVLDEYQVHYNTARPHQGIAQRVPDGRHDGGHLITADLDCARIVRKPVLGALINEYARAA